MVCTYSSIFVVPSYSPYVHSFIMRTGSPRMQIFLRVGRRNIFWGEGETQNTCASALSEGSFGVWVCMHHDDKTAGRG